VKRLAGTPELLDGPLDADVLAGNLRDLARVNRWLGGAALSWRAVRSVLATLPTDVPASVLDVGAGAADIPRHLLQQASAGPHRLTVHATDVRPEIVSAAQALTAADEGLSISLAAPGRLDFDDGSFDVVHASLVLHHLEPAQAGVLLAEMARVARAAVIVNDLDRAGRWWLAAWLLSHLASGNRYSRHDAPLSVRRAYRPAELAALAANAAGLHEVARYRALGGHRYALVLAR
jgi:ubiquinone/menaquinone biosynthesis C-methylase UbiE